MLRRACFHYKTGHPRAIDMPQEATAVLFDTHFGSGAAIGARNRMSGAAAWLSRAPRTAAALRLFP